MTINYAWLTGLTNPSQCLWDPNSRQTGGNIINWHGCLQLWMGDHISIIAMWGGLHFEYCDWKGCDMMTIESDIFERRDYILLDLVSISVHLLRVANKQCFGKIMVACLGLKSQRGGVLLHHHASAQPYLPCQNQSDLHIHSLFFCLVVLCIQ